MKQLSSLESQIEYFIEFKPYDEATEEVMAIIQQLVEEVIGEDEKYVDRHVVRETYSLNKGNISMDEIIFAMEKEMNHRNQQRAEQRERAKKLLGFKNG